MMKVLVCGGRDYADSAKVAAVLNEIDPLVVINGGAPGADTLASGWAITHNVPYVEIKANWGKDGKAAGPIRNQRMIDKCKPDLVVAFPGGRGTADMVARARKAGVSVREVTP